MEIYKYNVFAVCEGDVDSEDIGKTLYRHFSIRRKSGGGECSVCQVSTKLFCVSFRSEQVQNRVLAQKQHIVRTRHSELNVTVQLEQPRQSAAEKREAPVLDKPPQCQPVKSDNDNNKDSDDPPEEKGLISEIKLANIDHYLLIQPFKDEVEKQYRDVRIILDQQARCLRLQGPSEEVLRVKAKLQGSFERLKTKELSFPHPFISFLKSKGPLEVSTTYFLQAGIFVTMDVSVENQCVVLHGLSQYDLQRAEIILNERITMREVKLDDEMEPFTHTEGFDNFLVQLNCSQGEVQVSYELTGEGMKRRNCVTLVGYQEELAAVQEKILKFLREKSEEKDYLKVEGSEELMQNLPRLLDFLELDPRKVTIRWLPLKKKLEVSGSRRAIEEAKVAIREKTRGVLWKTVEVCRPGAFSYFSGSGQEYLNSVQAIFSCQPILRPKIDTLRHLLQKTRNMLEDIPTMEICQSKRKSGSGIGFGANENEAHLVVRNVTILIKHAEKVTELSDIIINPLCKSRTESKLLNAAGPTVKEELAKLSTVFWRSDITITGPGALPCRLLVHVPCLCDSSVDEHLQKTIQESKRRNFKLITVFIDINELHRGFDAECLANNLIMTALRNMNPEDGLRIVLPQIGLFNIFKNEAESVCVGINKAQKTDLLLVLASPIGVLGCLHTRNNPEEDTESLHRHSTLCELAVIDLFSKDLNLLLKAKSAVEKHYASFLANEMLVNPFIRIAGITARAKIQMLQHKHNVNVEVGDGFVVFNGLAINTSKARDEAWDILIEAHNLKEKDTQKHFARSTQWHFYNQEDIPMNLDPEDNYNTEIQYMSQRDPVTVKGEGEDTLIIDLQKMTAKNQTNGRVYKVVRTEVVEMARNVPGKWDEMCSYLFKRVPLDIETLEYLWVEKKFNKSLSSRKIVKIERVQNKRLWDCFSLNATQEVQNLFYGVKPGDEGRVEKNGFFRLEDGFFSSDTAQGKGIYFYMEASAAERKCEFDQRKQKRMFLGRVATGSFTLGRRGITEPPHPYRSVVDSMENPTVFVVFSPDVAYPEYCITFTE